MVAYLQERRSSAFSTSLGAAFSLSTWSLCQIQGAEEIPERHTPPYLHSAWLAQMLFLLVNKERGIDNRVARLALLASLKKEVEQVTAVPLLEGLWSIQTPSQGKERVWEIQSHTRRSKLEKDTGKVWR